MPATKIINVLRDDDFDSVFNAFEGTSAKEVILILPKNSRFSKKAENFMAIKQKAEELGKTISIMSEDVGIREFTEELGFKFLGIEKKPVKKKPPKPELASQPIEEFKKEKIVEIEPIKPMSALAKRGMADIVKNVSDNKVVIDPSQKEEDSETGEEIEINKEPPAELLEEPEPTPMIEETEEEPMLKEPEPTPMIEEESEIEEPEKEPEPTPMIEEESEIEEPEKEPEIEEPIHTPKPQEEPPVVTPLGKGGSSDIEKLWFGLAKTNKRLKERIPQNFASRKPTSRKKKYAYISAAVIFLVAVGLFTIFSKARVVLRPAKQAINFEIEVTASSTASKVDSVKNIIPGQLIFVEEEIQGTFNATGEDDVVKKSKGIINIVNNLSTKQTLIATTRFKAPSGDIYRIAKTVTVPAKGSLEIEIIADKAGEGFIEEVDTRLNIPGFKEAGLTDKYDNIYALAATKIDGGYIGEALLVTESDYNQGKESLLSQIFESTKDKLTQRIEGLDLTDSASEVEIKTIESTADIDDVADSFDITITTEGRAILFDKKNIATLIDSYLDTSGGLKMVQELTTISYADAEFDDSKELVTFRIKIDGQAAPQIDTSLIALNLLGKNENEITQYFRDLDEISSAKILLSPFWIKNVPNDLDRVKIDFEY